MRGHRKGYVGDQKEEEWNRREKKETGRKFKV